MMIWCLHVQGPTLGILSRIALGGLASSMLEAGEWEVRIKERGFEGCVSTEGKEGRLDTVSGIVFNAIFETDVGTTRMRFIVQPPRDSLD